LDNNDQGHEGPTRHRRMGPLGRILAHFERTLGAGILVILPIGITLLVLKFFFDLLNPILEPATDYLPGREVAGLGLAALVILVYVVGLVAAFVLGRRVIDLGHRAMEVIPLVKGIYGTTRAAVDLLSNTNGHRYSGVVVLDFPRVGIKSIGLITSRFTNNRGEDMMAIYIPTTPIPSSGFLVLVPVEEVTLTDMSVDEAMRIIISGGLLSGRVFERFEGVPQESPRSNQ